MHDSINQRTDHTRQELGPRQNDHQLFTSTGDDSQSFHSSEFRLTFRRRSACQKPHLHSKSVSTGRQNARTKAPTETFNTLSLHHAGEQNNRNLPLASKGFEIPTQSRHFRAQEDSSLKNISQVTTLLLKQTHTLQKYPNPGHKHHNQHPL